LKRWDYDAVTPANSTWQANEGISTVGGQIKGTLAVAADRHSDNISVIFDDNKTGDGTFGLVFDGTTWTQTTLQTVAAGPGAGKPLDIVYFDGSYNEPPIITSNGGGPTAAINAAENQTAVTTVTWTDSDVPANSITYALSGDDAALFSIDASGVLTFIAAPDFETFADFDLDGDLDLAVANGHIIDNIAVLNSALTHAQPDQLLENDGNGHFRSLESDVGAKPAVSRGAAVGDLDGDGDPDLYLANDFAPNNLLRNDGEGRFVDVTGESNTADIGFGMGASWGDYDFDGRPDLYVANMYSKAGRRITSQVPGRDPRLADMSRGNSLFRNRGKRFEKVSGLEPPALAVERAGWSWGGQFVDVDNDGFLDVYAASGMFTAPAEFAIPGADL